ncbi:hypothetical protein [Streptomyces canarius]
MGGGDGLVLREQAARPQTLGYTLADFEDDAVVRLAAGFCLVSVSKAGAHQPALR